MEAALRASTGYLLARLGAESRRRWASMLAEHGLTPHHFATLMVLEHERSTHQQRLSELIGVDPRNTLPVVDLLHRRGLVERRTDPADRRRHALTLTPAGQDLLRTLRHDGEAVEADLLAGITERERATLHRILDKLLLTTTPPKASQARSLTIP
jgi:DNA-binding MarR family transcriptional regulator